MAKWKDFLYFSKGDKTAVILLLILISICGFFLIYLNKFTSVDEVYIAQSEEVEKGFVEFQEAMTDTESPIEQEDAERKAPIRDKKTIKLSTSKLGIGQTIDINSVSKLTLTTIPGIGDTFAERIVEYRNSLGGFASLDQLMEIKGVTLNKYSKVLPYIVLNKKHKLIRINKISEEQLSAHPYFSEVQIKEIVKKRHEQKIISLDEFSGSDCFASRDLERLSPYISFE